MARSPVVYSPPPGTVPKVPLETIASATWNAFVNDVTLTFNTIQPQAYGGTGAATPATARANLGVNFYEADLSLTTNQQGQARANIGAGTQSRNYIMNGRSEVAQRTLPVAIASGGVAFGPDRWAVGCTTGITCSFGRVALPAGNPYGKFYMFATFSGTGASGSFMRHRIQGVETLAGEVATLSFAIADTFASAGVVQMRQFFGTGGSPSAAVAVNTPITITAGLLPDKLVLTIPSIAGKTLGTNGDDYLEFLFIPTIANAHTLSLGNVSLVQGDASDVADPYQARTYAEELALCQTFYERAFGIVRGFASGSGVAFEALVPWRVTKRATPVCALVSNGTVLNLAVQNLQHPSTSGVGLFIGSAAAGDAYAINAIVEGSAEL